MTTYNSIATVDDIRKLSPTERVSLETHMSKHKCDIEQFCFYWVFENIRYNVEDIIEANR
jgi:hypothetical protein